MNEELSKNGFIVLKSHYSEEEIATMKEEAMRCFENGGGFTDAEKAGNNIGGDRTNVTGGRHRGVTCRGVVLFGQQCRCL